MSEPGKRPRMKKTNVVDTNVILRFLLADHEAHYRHAEAFFSKVQAGTVSAFVPECVIAECVYVLQKVYGVPDNEITEKLIALLAYRGMTGSHVPPMREALRRFAADRISIVDALVLTVARHKGWDLESFGLRLQKLARA